MTAIDTNILINTFGADPIYGIRSKETFRSRVQRGALIACEVVLAEVIALFPTVTIAKKALTYLGVGYSLLKIDAALQAGRLWKAYRAKGGKRTRMVADFLIGAHAFHQADALLTRDRGFYRTGMSSLKIIDPSS
ncbi:type II toxin-antitoxin system VapC family toxin [Candidatus Nitrospira salsa]